MNLFLKTIHYTYILSVVFLTIILIFPVQSAAQEKSYQIGANDILILTIYAGGEKQHEGDLTVSGQGTINAPFIGTIQAKGLTPSQLEEKITEPLARDYFVNPKVNVSIKEYHSLQYYISGAVKKPGMYEMTTEASLLELIAKSEGVLPERGNVAYIMRAGIDTDIEDQETENQISIAEPIKVDLKRLLDKGDMAANPILKPGDVVYIPLKESLDLAESKIYVEGEVEKPGIYDYQPGMTALNACIMAGGFTTFAAPNRARIIRQKEEDTETIKINLNEVKKGEISDIELKPGDRIHIPETWL
ncbi:MAG: polysaccharide biosynthesis/export family protein [Thermodesulfobacteriota bacterium]